jgi:hypothetical protein
MVVNFLVIWTPLTLKMIIDVFNGDADGICALQQLRLAQPCEARLISGVKRDIRLLDQVVEPVEVLTVLDVSMSTNRQPLELLLAQGSHVLYADHHDPGVPLTHPLLVNLVDADPAICTGLIMNRYLQNQFPAWGVVAAFGDNLHDSALQLAGEHHLVESEIQILRELGELLNYNGYGKSVDDLHFDPVDLYKALHPYVNPVDFYNESSDLAQLRQGFHDDMGAARRVKPFQEKEHGRVYQFPDEPWARRVVGVFANERAREAPDKGHALLVADGQGGYVVSVRAPLASKQGAVELCRQFPSGGGRAAAAGINHLPEADLDAFLDAFSLAW